MSEGNVPSRQTDSGSLDSEARADQIPTQQPDHGAAHDDWEVVPLSSMPPLADVVAAAVQESPRPLTRSKEAELQTRIRDLNQCNEVLLSRVHQLEEALERSQQTLQQEVERSQRAVDEGKVAVAQNHSVAQLLKELEQSNAALERQTILAETLEAQLQTFQERSENLEKECALLRKQHAEKAQRLQVAEESCADLRSRLQRQQRYTLQFKAALEKCLDTSAFKHTSTAIEDGSFADSFPSEPAPNVNPLVMPRSERIQPWSASHPAAQADPQLLSLMRSQPAQPESAPAATPSPRSTPATDPVAPEAAAAPSSEVTAVSHEAKEQLWQDVERVIDTTTAASTIEVTAEVESGAAEKTQFTEPIPWGAPISKETPEPSEAETPVNTAAETPSRSPQADQSDAKTEPRSPVAPETTPPHQPPQVPVAYRQPSFAASIPALDAMATAKASPSPIVHPLRPNQPKRKSLSAVELPSFPPLPKVEN